VQAGTRVAPLTGLRGFAILIVFVSHCANAGYLPVFLGKGAGQLGVMLFFVLSGFLMASLYAGRAPDRAAATAFLAARLGRVAPLYLLVVALSAAAGDRLAGWPYAVVDGADLARHLLFLRGDAELWAVPVEVQFYLIFLAIWASAWHLGRFDRRAWAVLLAAALGAGLSLSVLHETGRLPWDGVYRYAPYFLLGALLPAASAPLGRLLDRATARVGEAGLSLIVLAALVASLPGLRRALGIPAPLWLDPTVAFAVVATFVLSWRGIGVFGLMAARPLVLLGTVSYGFYLTHPIVLGLHRARIGSTGPGAVATVFAASLLLAALSYVVVERPALRWIRRQAPR
jgi:peptidoglycan/LPS O-acetylase OafA/YrhL